MNNHQVFEYLTENFDSVKELPGGGHRATHNGNLFYISSDFTGENVTVKVDYPGIGGRDWESKSYLEDLDSGNVPSNTIVMFAEDPYSDNGMMEKYETMYADLELDVSSFQGKCFSGSGGTFMSQANTYVGNHPGEQPTLVFNDAYCMVEDIKKGRASVEHLRNAQTPIILTTRPGDARFEEVKKDEEYLRELGLNTYIVTIGKPKKDIWNDLHAMANDVVRDDDLMGYLAGTNPVLGTTVVYGMMKYVDGAYMDISMADFSKYDKSRYLENLTFFPTLVDSTKTTDGVVRLSSLNISDSDILNSYLNNIILEIKKDSFIDSGSTVSFESTTQIPQSYSNLVNAYAQTNVDLMYELAQVTTWVAKIGESKEQMDNEMATVASNLGLGAMLARITELNSQLGIKDDFSAGSNNSETVGPSQQQSNMGQSTTSKDEEKPTQSTTEISSSTSRQEVKNSQAQNDKPSSSTTETTVKEEKPASSATETQSSTSRQEVKKTVK